MHKKVKFERWTAISYNFIKPMTGGNTEYPVEKIYESLKMHQNADIRRSAKDLSIRVKQLLSVKSNVKYKIGKIKTKKKRVVKI